MWPNYPQTHSRRIICCRMLLSLSISLPPPPSVSSSSRLSSLSPLSLSLSLSLSTLWTREWEQCQLANGVDAVVVVVVVVVLHVPDMRRALRSIIRGCNSGGGGPPNGVALHTHVRWRTERLGELLMNEVLVINLERAFFFSFSPGNWKGGGGGESDQHAVKLEGETRADGGDV